MLVSNDFKSFISNDLELEFPIFTPPRICRAGMIMIMLEPMEENSPRTFCVELRPRLTIMITEAIPMMIPSMVRNERPLLRSSAVMAILTRLRMFMV